MTHTEGHSFFLDPQLAAATLEVGTLPLSLWLLHKDARFPWLILVPQRRATRELTDLTPADQHQLVHEINLACHAWQTCVQPDKLNIAMLGNRVPQLHVHVIARFTTDAAWPNPVWGHGTPQPYDAETQALRLQQLRAALGTALH